MKAKGQSCGIPDLRAGLETIQGLPPEILDQPVIKAAFRAAKGNYKGMYDDADDPNDSKLQWQEFRIFLIFMKQYFRFYVLFKTADTSGDGQISIEEFKKAASVFEEWGQKIENPEEEFNKIDTGKEKKDGALDFKEFTTWAIQYSIGKMEDGGKDDEIANQILQDQAKADAEQANA